MSSTLEVKETEDRNSTARNSVVLPRVSHLEKSVSLDSIRPKGENKELKDEKRTENSKGKVLKKPVIEDI